MHTLGPASSDPDWLGRPVNMPPVKTPTPLKQVSDQAVPREQASPE
jgi:hypothetical protein